MADKLLPVPNALKRPERIQYNPISDTESTGHGNRRKGIIYIMAPPETVFQEFLRPYDPAPFAFTRNHYFSITKKHPALEHSGRRLLLKREGGLS